LDCSKLSEHIIDFFVIFAADLAAAYVALRWFESRTEARKEERRRAMSSLNEVARLSAQLKERYSKIRENLKNSSDSTATNLPSDLNETDRRFFEIDQDYLFWSFDNSKHYRDQYDKIKDMKKALSAKTVGQARSKLTALIDALTILMEMISKAMGR
jgi:hypothetical protein